MQIEYIDVETCYCSRVEVIMDGFIVKIIYLFFQSQYDGGIKISKCSSRFSMSIFTIAVSIIL